MGTGSQGAWRSTGTLVDAPGAGGRWVRTVSIDEQGGGTTDYWETLWADEKVEAPAFLLQVLRAELAGRRRVLESGCGKAPFVEALATPDNVVIGVDLAERALVQAHHRNGELRLAVADVSQLPFAAGSFDAVVSLGVVEHFEGGPIEVLRDHARVLADDGILVLTVPRRSWLRAVRDLWHLGVRRADHYATGRRTVTRREVGRAASVPGAFHQYEFSKAQLLGYLREAGFEVTSWKAVDVGSALGEAGLSRFASRPAGAGSASGHEPVAVSSPRARRLRGRVADMVLGTGPTGPVGRSVRRLAADAIGHLQLVVAVPARRA